MLAEASLISHNLVKRRLGLVSLTVTCKGLMAYNAEEDRVTIVQDKSGESRSLSPYCCANIVPRTANNTAKPAASFFIGVSVSRRSSK
jgi:hypothetical protein